METKHDSISFSSTVHAVFNGATFLLHLFLFLRHGDLLEESVCLSATSRDFKGTLVCLISAYEYDCAMSLIRPLCTTKKAFATSALNVMVPQR